MPDGHDRVLAVLLQRGGHVSMVGEEVDGRASGHVEEDGEGEGVVSEGRHGPRLDDPLYHPQALHAPLEVLRVLEVVECDGRVVVRVCVYEV